MIIIVFLVKVNKSDPKLKKEIKMSKAKIVIVSLSVTVEGFKATNNQF